MNCGSFLFNTNNTAFAEFMRDSLKKCIAEHILISEVVTHKIMEYEEREVFTSPTKDILQ